MDALTTWFTEPFTLINGQRALLAAVLIGFTNGYTSAYVVLKRSALKVGSLSHSLLPGIALAIMVAGLSQASAFLGAVFAALITGLGSLFIARSSRIDQDTALAVLFTTAFAAGILLMHFLDIPSELDHWLFGNILGMSDADLWTAFGIGAGATLFLTLFQRPIVVTLFEPEVAASLGIPVRALSYGLMGMLVLVLVSSIQAVGCILVLALLAAPAATVSLFSDSPRTLFWAGGAVGAAGSALALVAAYHLDLPAGSSIVVVLGLIFALAYTTSPKYGLAKVIRQQFSRG
ncbi:metal ABC transporter permease [soil metagenome]